MLLYHNCVGGTKLRVSLCHYSKSISAVLLATGCYTHIKGITHTSLTRYECTPIYRVEKSDPAGFEPGTPASWFKLSRYTTYLVTPSPNVKNKKMKYIKKCVLRTCFTLAYYRIYIRTYVPICSLVH